MNVVYQIDSNGFHIEDRHVNDLNSVDFNYTTIAPPTGTQGFYKAKWTGKEWVEGATQEEIAELTAPIIAEPSELDILRDYVLEMELRMIMKELGV